MALSKNAIRDWKVEIAKNGYLALLAKDNSVSEREKVLQLNIIEFYTLCEMELNRILKEIKGM